MSSQKASPRTFKWPKSKRKPLKPLVFKGEEVKRGYLVIDPLMKNYINIKKHDGYLELISVNLSRNSRSDETIHLFIIRFKSIIILKMEPVDGDKFT